MSADGGFFVDEVDFDAAVCEVEGGLDAGDTGAEDEDFLGDGEGFGGDWALSGGAENGGADEAFGFGSSAFGVVLVDPGAVFADVGEGDLSAGHAGCLGGLVEMWTKEVGAAGSNDETIELVFGDGLGEVLKGFVLAPVRASFYILGIGEGFGEGGEVGVVEGVADGVTAVAENDADVH